MEQNTPNRLPHILIQDTASSERYTSPVSARKVFKLPHRDREIHGKNLLYQFEQIKRDSTSLFAEQRAFGIDAGNGLLLRFESEPGFELKFESLEMIPSKVELLAVQEIDRKTYATVFVPEGKLHVLEKKVIDYLEQTTKKGKAKNRGLVESISAIRQAAFEALWTDEGAVIPKDETQDIWWEVWLRAGINPKSNLDFFKTQAERLGISVSPGNINFPDRIVIAVRGTKAQLSRSITLLNSIAELRKAKDTADFFTGLDSKGQMAWITALQSQLISPQDHCPIVCILDTGINNGHPLLHNYLSLTNMHTYNPAWNVTDHEGHGTEMAGLVLYGDLTEALSQTALIEISHNLESVKIMPPRGENPPHLYGDITAEAIARAEVQNPAKQRIVCMAVSADDTRDQGRPSSWSARIDDLAADDQGKRLIIIAAGNTPLEERHNFPYSNIADRGIHDPGQAWNAITVGAYTAKDSIDHTEYPDWHLVAQPGDLGPSSSTSNTWKRPWPIKPDIVMEGGNMAIDPAAGKADYLDSLGLLTTHYRHATKPLVVTGDTSAATALASRMAARLQAQYPEYWSETIRGLMIHSAEWTDVMRNNFDLRNKRNYENMLRYCGFGVPSLERALWSAQNSVSLISQDSLQPFDKKDSQYVTRDLNIHQIPWPVDILQGLGETNVEMRVTLSYFIEPNPARRGWGRKYSYASHGYRFDVKRPLETLSDFKARINRAAWDEETGRPSTYTEDSEWELGPQLRKLGSIHSDTWRGTAAALAGRGHIAVYPVIGWWRENPRHGRWSKRARYSLLVTIRTPETNIKLYSAIMNMIRQPVEITIS
jgi:hypothetical protein